jgi:arginine metabolism regulation protein II
MQESTDLSCKGLGSDAHQELPSQNQTSPPLHFLEDSDTVGDWLQDQNESYHDIDLSACEFVYGVPLDLLVLLSKASVLIRGRKRFAREHPNSLLPKTLEAMCDELEGEILNWPVDQIVSKMSTLPTAKDSRDLMEHQTRAFHQAIIIYFSRLVRNMHPSHLQQYTLNIMYHLEEMEVVKYKANLITGCILWPGFLGAAEATSEKLQSRYVQWLKSRRIYGLASYDKAQEVVMEVWERRRSGSKQSHADWFTVIEEKDIKLMLT